MVDTSIEVERDNGGRRTGFDRRQFNYSSHIPERRSNQDRRSGTDRRAGTMDRRNDMERRAVLMN